MAQTISDRLLGKTVLAYATSFYIPQFAGSHVNIVYTGTMAAAAYLQHLEAEATAMAFVKEWSGLDIKLDVNALDAGTKYLTFQLDPARDINLFADAILDARRGNLGDSARTMGRLIKHLLEQYDVSVSGAYHGQNIDVYFRANL